MEAIPDRDALLKTEMRRRAHDLGFELFGVARAEPLGEDLVRLKAWLQEGNAAGMDFLSNHPEQRSDPALLIKAARSVVMVGMSYAQQPPDLSSGTGRHEGKIARFALGRDYHHIMRPRLEQLAHWLAEETSGAAHSHCYVDSGPLLERGFASRAGLGFIGKNNCLIHPLYGSWLLLGGIVTNVDMIPDQPMGTQCHGCRMCLDACPTSALCQPHKLDARRCLSYWTIETHDMVDPAIISHIGNRIFGCDTCQEVCPFNRAAFQCVEPDLKPGQEQGHANPANASLEAILGVESNRQFDRIYHGSSLSRARYKGLMRNALIAGANLRRTDLRQRIKDLSQDTAKPDVIRETARWALGRLDNLLGY